MHPSSRRERRAAAPDPDLPVLSAPDAGWLRTRAVAELARAGVHDVRDLGDHLALPDGTRMGLGALALALSRRHRLSWRRLVRRQARAVVRLRDTPPPADLRALLALVVARVVADDGTTADPDRYGPSLGAGLRAVACLDHPEQVVGPVPLAAYGGWEAVAPTALGRLRALPAPTHRTLRAEGGAAVEVFLADDVFGASRLLVLDALLASALRVERPRYGTLVVVPNRHLLAVHPLARRDEALAALRLLTTLATAAHAAVAPVSPQVLYRSPDGVLEPVTHAEPGGTRVRVEGAFAAALAALPGS